VTDWLSGWTNWLRTVAYPIPLKHWVCSRRGHNDYLIGDISICLRCGRNDADPPRPTVQVGCAHCPTVLEVPFGFTVTEPDEEGHQYLEFDPDMADLWAHSWRHTEGS
jgi:hypothetical protein